jgi:hypothetical protein
MARSSERAHAPAGVQTPAATLGAAGAEEPAPAVQDGARRRLQARRTAPTHRRRKPERGRGGSEARRWWGRLAEAVRDERPARERRHQPWPWAAAIAGARARSAAPVAGPAPPRPRDGGELPRAAWPCPTPQRHRAPEGEFRQARPSGARVPARCAPAWGRAAGATRVGVAVPVAVRSRPLRPVAWAPQGGTGRRPRASRRPALARSAPAATSPAPAPHPARKRRTRAVTSPRGRPQRSAQSSRAAARSPVLPESREPLPRNGRRPVRPGARPARGRCSSRRRRRSGRR